MKMRRFETSVMVAEISRFADNRGYYEKRREKKMHRPDQNMSEHEKHSSGIL